MYICDLAYVTKNKILPNVCTTFVVIGTYGASGDEKRGRQKVKLHGLSLNWSAQNIHVCAYADNVSKISEAKLYRLYFQPTSLH